MVSKQRSRASCIISHFFVVGVLDEEVSGVRLLGGVRGQQACAVRVAAPDGGAKGGQQVLELAMQAVWVCGEVEQGVALLGQLLGQAGDLAGQLAVLWIVELGDATVGGAAAGRQAEA